MVNALACNEIEYYDFPDSVLDIMLLFSVKLAHNVYDPIPKPRRVTTRFDTMIALSVKLRACDVFRL